MLLQRRILLKVENKYFSLSLNLSQDIAINSRVLASWKYFDISVSKLFHITLRSSSPTDSEQLLSVNFHTLIIKSRLPLLWLFTIFTVLQNCFMLSYDHLNGLLNPISSRWSKMFLVSQMSARKTEWQAVKIFIWNNDKYHDATMQSAMIVQDGLFSEFYLVDYSLLFQIKMPIFEYFR